MRVLLNIDHESCFPAHTPKLEQAGMLNLDTFSNCAALLVGLERTDFDWENLLALVQHHDMKIKRGHNGSLPLAGFDPQVAAVVQVE